MDSKPMAPAELRVVREQLGLTGDALAAHLRVSGRTVRHWEEGKYAVPSGVADELGRLERRTDAFVDDLVEQWAGQSAPTLSTYRTDEDYREDDPAGTLPASWHRAAVARARTLLSAGLPAPGRVVYADPVTAPVIPALSILLFCQLLDALTGVFVDEPARADARAFLLGEVEDLLDDRTEKTAYPDLLDAVRTWTPKQAAGVLDAAERYRAARSSGADHGAGLQAAGYPDADGAL